MAQPELNPRKVEPAVFNNSVEGLLIRGVGDRLSAEARAEIRALGIDLDRPLAPAYSIEQWVAAVAVAVRALYPNMPPEEAYFQLGIAFIDGLARTLVGKALFAFGKVVGPHRMLGRMTSAFRSSNNYIESELTGSELVTRVVPALLPKMEGRPAIPPQYMRGILHRCLTLGGARSAEVTLVSHDPLRRESRYALKFAV